MDRELRPPYDEEEIFEIKQTMLDIAGLSDVTCEIIANMLWDVLFYSDQLTNISDEREPVSAMAKARCMLFANIGAFLFGVPSDELDNWTKGIYTMLNFMKDKVHHEHVFLPPGYKIED